MQNKLAPTNLLEMCIHKHVDLPEVMSGIKYQLLDIYFYQYRSDQKIPHWVPHSQMPACYILSNKYKIYKLTSLTYVHPEPNYFW